MPSSNTRHPKAATCEEVDEATQKVKPGSRTSANVSKKRSQSSDLNRKSAADKQSQHGSDSGYSSKAGTNESMASNYKRPNPLTVDTGVMDRTARPYSHTPAKSDPAIRTSVNVEVTKAKASKKEQRFRHPPGICTSCDDVGFHCERSVADSILAAARAKASTKVNKQSKNVAEKRQIHRTSSHTGERPYVPVMIAPQPPMLPPIYAPELTYPQTYGPPTPLTPAPYYVPPSYTYGTVTPVTAPCHDCAATVDGMYSLPATPQYNELPMITYPSPMNYPQLDDQPLLHPHHRRLSNEAEHAITYVVRPHSTVPRSSKIQADRQAMPPPPRPGTRRLSTEGSQAVARRTSVFYDDDDRPMVNPKRTSRDMSTGPPPSAWKTSGYGDVHDRPLNRKSASYSDGSTDHSSSAHREPLARRVTDPVDERTAFAEAYQKKFSKGGSDSLTLDALRKLEKQRSPPSEAGTVQSKDSARGKRSSTIMSTSGYTNITVGGVHISLSEDMPDQDLSFRIGNLTISTNGQTEQKQIERAPSNASRDSRRTTSGTSGVVESDVRNSTSKRSNHEEKEQGSTPSSKRLSRTPSTSEQAS